MEYYWNPQNQYQNRAYRRKNGIKPEKKVYRSKEEFERLEKVLKKELYDLTHESYSEALKREKYQRLKPLIEEYERQKAIRQAPKMQKAIAAYQVQTNYSKSHGNFKTLSKPATKPAPAVKTATQVAKPAPVTKPAPKNVTSRQTQKAPKKGFFRRLFDMFKPQPQPVPPKAKPVEQRKPIDKLQVNQVRKVQTKYNPLREIEKVGKDISTAEFEKAWRDMNNYSKENPNCRIYRNGRELDLGGR